MHRTLALMSVAICVVFASPAGAQTREEKVRADRKKVEAEGFWIYNDMARGFAEAKMTGKPMLVVLRCIPCVECVKLDDELVNQDPHVKPLLQKFVCVRQVSTNGLDLATFQYDYDQSFAVFMLNADGTIYGRFGTRSHRTIWADDVSVEGLAKALAGALELHAAYPKNKAELAAKRGPAPDVASPELYPTLKGKYAATVDFQSKPVASCIHCHQIGDAQKQMRRLSKEPMGDKVLFPYPHPKILGLILDPKERATVLRVDKNSLAEKAGFQKGDRILRLDGQPLLSIADVQWVLHRQSGNGGGLKAQVERGGSQAEVSLALPKNWRHADDISWRSSTWGLRRMATGGMALEALTSDERAAAKLPGEGMALRVKHVGQFGPHAAAKNAGFLKDDVLIAFDGKSNLARETDLIAYALTTRKPGEKVDVKLLRAGKSMTLTLPMQE